MRAARRHDAGDAHAHDTDRTRSAVGRSSPNPQWVVSTAASTCRSPRGARTACAQGHIPGALLRAILTGTCPAPAPPTQRRHPLPSPAGLRGDAAGAGASMTSDRRSWPTTRAMALYAARLWWMLRWLGHAQRRRARRRLAAWQRAGLPVTDRRTAAGARLRTSRAPGDEPSQCAARRAALRARRARARRDAAGRCARRRPLRRRERDARSGRRARARARATIRSRAISAADGTLPDCAASCAARWSARSPARRAARWWRCAAPASPPATTCWRWKSPGCTGAQLYAGSWSEWITRSGATGRDAARTERLTRIVTRHTSVMARAIFRRIRRAAESDNTASSIPRSPGGSRTRSSSTTCNAWGKGYFGINAAGHVVVRPDTSRPSTRSTCYEVVEGLEGTRPDDAGRGALLGHPRAPPASACTTRSRRPSPRTTTRTATRRCSRSRSTSSAWWSRRSTATARSSASGSRWAPSPSCSRSWR